MRAYLSDVSSRATRVAILIPFRKREEHLQILLNNLHPFLFRQQLDYTVYVVEQVFTKHVRNSRFDKLLGNKTIHLNGHIIKSVIQNSKTSYEPFKCIKISGKDIS